MNEVFERVELRVAIALIVGLVIGAEREQRRAVRDAEEAHHREGTEPVERGPRTHQSAGIRTFAIVSLLGAVGVLLEQPWTLAAFAMGIIAATLVSYALGERTDPGLTTEVALMLTFGLGALAISQPMLSLAIGITTALLLAFRTHIHAVVQEVLSPAELRDALIVAGAALVALPLLPDRAVDPWNVINPFVLWRLVVVILSVHLGAHVARRVFGARWGMAIAGLASGFVSSSATIAAMGSQARREPTQAKGAIAAGTASTVATFVQLFLVVSTASPELAQHLLIPLGAGASVALLIAGVYAYRAAKEKTADKLPEHAVNLRGAFLFVALVTGVSVLSTFARIALGDGGVIAMATLAAFADAHASAASVASVEAAGGITESVAVVGVLACLSSNALTKVVLAFTSGTRSYGLQMGAATCAVVAASWIGWALTA
jgi:uncharacterized membrane protein (DUF4010 family)